MGDKVGFKKKIDWEKILNQVYMVTTCNMTHPTLNLTSMLFQINRCCVIWYYFYCVIWYNRFDVEIKTGDNFQLCEIV